MSQKSILSHIRTMHLKHVLYPLLLLLIALVILWKQPIFDFLHVRDVSESEALSRAVNEQADYVRTTAHNLYYTGNDFYRDGDLTGHIYYELQDSYCRFYVLTPAAGRPAETYIPERLVTGRLEKIDADTREILEDMAEALNWSTDGLAGVCDPYMINEVVYFSAPRRILFYAVILALLTGAAGLLYTLALIIFPRLSGTVRRLSGYGDREEILAEADEELSGEVLLSRGTMILTPRYLFDFSPDVSAIVPLESALWVFDTQNMRYSLRDRREKMFYTLRIVTISGDTFVLKEKEKEDLTTIMDVLTERYPNFFYGYSEDHYAMVQYILKENRREIAENRKKRSHL